MKINPITNPNILKSYIATRPAPSKQRAGSGRDELTITEEALSFSKALDQARETIEFRSPEEREHIAKVTDAVRQGTYRVSSDEIADKILESVFRR